MNSPNIDARPVPGDLATAIEQIRVYSLPVTNALEYVSKRADASDASPRVIHAWTVTRDLLRAVSDRYDGVAAILRGEQPEPPCVNEDINAEKLSDNLGPLEHIVAGWRQFTAGKWQATKQTDEIWTSVLSRSERISPENQERLSTFAADRRDLEAADERLNAALEYLWRNGAQGPEGDD
jgi:hypothetical protein